MKRRHRITGTLITLFFLIGSALMYTRLSVPPSITFSNDAGEYHSGAIGIAESGSYFNNGLFITEREPGYSIFLGLIYFIFGQGNRFAVFTIQMLLYVTSVFIFLDALRKHTNTKAVMLCGAFLLFLPTVFHNFLMINRETIALSFFLLFTAGFLHLIKKPTWKNSTLTGAAFGAGVLTFLPFYLFPIPLLALLIFLKIPKKLLIPVIGIPLIFLGIWFARNASHGVPHLLRPFRTAQVWSIRASQAENQQIADPIKCMWNEYITRRWENISREECRPDGFIHPEHRAEMIETDEGAKLAARESQMIILRNLPTYLWASAFWALEYHLPYVNGWGLTYNLLEVAATIILYIGCILYFIRFRKNFEKTHLLYFLMMLYGTGVFAAAYSVPRFRMPVLFCYCVISAIGYVNFLKTKPSPSSFPRNIP